MKESETHRGGTLQMFLSSCFLLFHFFRHLLIPPSSLSFFVLPFSISLLLDSGVLQIHELSAPSGVFRYPQSSRFQSVRGEKLHGTLT